MCASRYKGFLKFECDFEWRHSGIAFNTYSCYNEQINISKIG